MSRSALDASSGGPYGGNHEQLRGYRLWAELHQDMHWYVVDGLGGTGQVLSGPHGSARAALWYAEQMTHTGGS